MEISQESPPSGALVNVRRTTLVDEVIAQLSGMIAARPASGGDRLPSEAEMAKSLGVGRSTLREAIRVLSHLGIVESRSGTGTFVTGRHLRPSSPSPDLSETDMREVLDFRYGVELVACRLAAERRTDMQMKAIRDAWSACITLTGSESHVEFARRDYEFHRSVVAASANRLLVKSYEFGAETICRMSELLLQLGPLQPMNAFHDALIHAIEAKDGQAAEDAARENFDEVAVRLRLFAAQSKF